MAAEPRSSRFLDASEQVGQNVVGGVGELGHGGALFAESLYWLFLGRFRRQPVRLPAVVAEMREIGVAAVPIVTLLSVTIGVMLAIQGIHTLKTFGAESQVVLGVALSVTREFAPLITGVLVAGRSGSALAARLATMTINQEVDALRVMGVNPVRFLVVPSLLGAVVMLPLLTLWADIVAQTASALYVRGALGLGLVVYFERTIDVLTTDDLLHGLVKALLFAVLITLIAVVNGSSVEGGAEGVGKRTTRTVVHSIAAILITDMVFVWLTTQG